MRGREPKTTIRPHPREFRRRTDTEKTAVPESEAELRTALESAGLGVFDYYPLSGELRWNGAAREHFGLSPDAPVNYNVFLVGLHPDDRARVVRVLQRALERGQDGRFSAEFRTIGIEDGKERLIAMSGQAFFNQWGEAARMVAATREKPSAHLPQQADDLFRTVFDSVNEGILLHAADGSILDMNDRFLAMYRIEREQLRGMSIADISSPSNPLEELPGIWERVVAGERRVLEWKARRPADNSTFDVEVFLTRMDVLGRPLILATVRDISERKRLAEAVLQSERLYRLLFHKSPLPKWVFDLESFRFLEVNEAAVNHYGYSREEFLGLTIRDIRTPEEFKKLESRTGSCCANGEKFEGQVQTRHRKKSGETIDADVRYTEISYNGKRAALGVMIDITERKQAEEALRESEARLRQMADAMPQLVWTARPDGTVDYYNRRVGEFEGCEQRSDGTWNWASVLHPDDVERSVAAWRQAIETGDTYQIEHRVRKKDGGYRWYLSRGEAVRDAGGGVAKWIGTATDIDDMKQAQAELARTVADLQRSNRELQQFAYVASHDLQEPLRTVGNYVELLAMKYRGKLDAPADRYIEYAVEGANRMSALINDLLAYSRVGTRGTTFSDVDMSEVYRHALDSLTRAIRENHAVVTAGTLPVVRGNEMQLRQLVQNLLANAIKFRKPGVPPRIEVTAEKKGAEQIVSITDNGIGIEPRFFDRIFTIFQRLHTRDEYPGTGVGLAICRRIVERHGGRIWVESKPGEGSTFRFSLPGREARNG